MGKITEQNMERSTHRTYAGMWKQYLTAEHIALIVTGLDNYISTDKALSDIDGPTAYCHAVKAIAIRDNLIDEITLLDKQMIESSYLVISTRATTDEGCLNAEQTTITRESAAQWFLSLGDLGGAQLLIPSIENNSLLPKQITKPRAPEKSSKLRVPESSLLDSLGILAYMLSESAPKFKWGENPNAKGIAEAIAQKAASLGVEVKELTNLQKDISIAVEKVAPRIKK
tara:strand:+ start:1079 stop:1762 length:684 start_codon:yes stop_codon:yes gene_type:complete